MQKNDFSDLEQFEAKGYRLKIKGKDGRFLSDFQRKPWMDRIGKLRTYKNQARGEKTGRAKLKEADVLWIRSNYFPWMSRKWAKQVATKFGIHPSYVYHIRAKKRWAWL